MNPLLFAAYFYVGQDSRLAADALAKFGFWVSLAIFLSVISAIVAQITIGCKREFGLNRLGISRLTTVGGWIAPIAISALITGIWWALWNDKDDLASTFFADMAAHSTSVDKDQIE